MGKDHKGRGERLSTSQPSTWEWREAGGEKEKEEAHRQGEANECGRWARRFVRSVWLLAGGVGWGGGGGAVGGIALLI